MNCFDGKSIMYIIDRIEKTIAVCENEDGSMVNIPINIIKGNIRDGAIIVKEEAYFVIDENKSKNREKKISDLTKGMWSYE